MYGAFFMTDLKYFTLDENGHVIFFSEHPPCGNPAYAHGTAMFIIKWCNSENFLNKFGNCVMFMDYNALLTLIF